MFLERENTPGRRFEYNDSRISYMKGNKTSIFYENINYNSFNIKKPKKEIEILTSFQKKIFSMYDRENLEKKNIDKTRGISSKGTLFKSKSKPFFSPIKIGDSNSEIKTNSNIKRDNSYDNSKLNNSKKQTLQPNQSYKRLNNSYNFNDNTNYNLNKSSTKKYYNPFDDRHYYVENDNNSSTTKNQINDFNLLTKYSKKILKYRKFFKYCEE